MPRKNRDEQKRYLHQQSQITAYLVEEIRCGKYYFHSSEIAEAAGVPIRVVGSYLSFLKRFPETGVLQVKSRSFTRSTTWEIREKRDGAYDITANTAGDAVFIPAAEMKRDIVLPQNSIREELS